MKNTILIMLITLVLFNLALLCEGAIPKDNLVLYLSMDEGAVAQVKDGSGNGNDGVVIGNPEWVEGKFGTAIELDGVDDVIEVEDSDSLNPKEITITLWVKLGVVPAPAYNGIISKWAPSWSGYLIQAYVDHPIAPLIANGSTFAAIRGLKGIKQDIWYHVGVVWDGKTLSMYIDGAEPDYDVGASDHEMPGEMVVPEINLLIGKRHDGAFFKGSIDEVMIFNEALSLEDIKSIMKQGLSVENTGKLIATWGSLKEG